MFYLLKFLKSYPPIQVLLVGSPFDLAPLIEGSEEVKVTAIEISQRHVRRNDNQRTQKLPTNRRQPHGGFRLTAQDQHSLIFIYFNIGNQQSRKEYKIKLMGEVG